MGTAFIIPGVHMAFLFLGCLTMSSYYTQSSNPTLSTIRGGMVMTSGVVQIVRAIEKQILYLL